MNKESSDIEMIFFHLLPQQFVLYSIAVVKSHQIPPSFPNTGGGGGGGGGI